MVTNVVSNIITSGGDIINNPSKKKKLNPKIIRIGDRVRIINPEVITRIGYPMSFGEACEEVEKLHKNKIINFLKEIYPDIKIDIKLLFEDFITCEYQKLKSYKKIIYALAYEHMQNRGFGGNKRELHIEYRRDLLGEFANVYNTFIRKTGIYYPPSGGYDSWNNEYDYNPGGLDKIKTHKILEIYPYNFNQVVQNWSDRYLKIEACNVEKLPQ